MKKDSKAEGFDFSDLCILFESWFDYSSVESKIRLECPHKEPH